MAKPVAGFIETSDRLTAVFCFFRVNRYPWCSSVVGYDSTSYVFVSELACISAGLLF
jgi:hypothetical protein